MQASLAPPEAEGCERNFELYMAQLRKSVATSVPLIQTDDEIVESEDELEELVSHERLDDGRLEITTNKRIIVGEKDAADELASMKKLRNFKFNEAGYICSGQTALHRVIGDKFCETDAQVRNRFPEHFAKNPHDITVIMHLDNDKGNFNVTNLIRGPQMLNNYMKMSQPHPNLKKFNGHVTVSGKQTATKSVATMEEAKHAIDILKIQMMPLYFRDFIFQYAMHKPGEFAKHYTSVETLLARAPVYAKKFQKPQKARVSKNTYAVYRTLDEARKALDPKLMKIITTMLDTPGVPPFDETLDAVVFYKGAKAKQFVFLLENECFEKYIKPTMPAMGVNPSGYIQIMFGKKLRLLHLVVMERDIGQKSRDGLEGGHGWAKTLDNRKRVLKPQTKAENLSQRGGCNDKSVPGVVGVYKIKNGTFEAQINSFFERADNVHLGIYTTIEQARAVYQFAANNKAALVEACKDLADRNAELRKRCIEKLIN